MMLFSICLYGQGKKRVVVLETQGTASVAHRDEIKNALIRGIANNPNLSVVGRGELLQVMQQQGMQMNDAFSESQAIEVGRLTQAQYVCVSSVNTANEYEYRISYKLIDLETGETVEGTDVREKATNVNFYEVVDKIAESKLFANNVKTGSSNGGSNISVCGCEIQKQDLPQGAKIPAGWRLPTLKELKCMCENKEKIGGFNFGAYMSSTKQQGDYKGIKFQFCDEVFILGNYSIRVVR